MVPDYYYDLLVNLSAFLLLKKKKGLKISTLYLIVGINLKKKNGYRDFPGGAVVKNPPANAGDTGSSPGLGRSHMPRSN